MSVRATIAACLCLIALGVTDSDAQTPTTLSRREAMQRFTPWLGEWRGGGWTIDATGRRTEFALVERVQPRVDGTVLLLEGHGTATGPGHTGETTHDGLVVVYFDEHMGQYRWNGHEARSGTADVELRVFDGGVAWTLPQPGTDAHVRITITFDGNRWRETGQASGDGQTWATFMEVNLDRVR
jgi:hypothetical protein